MRVIVSELVAAGFRSVTSQLPPYLPVG